jgi:hypothetical protein
MSVGRVPTMRERRHCADWHSSRHHLRHAQRNTGTVLLRASRHVPCARGVSLS